MSPNGTVSTLGRIRTCAHGSGVQELEEGGKDQCADHDCRLGAIRADACQHPVNQLGPTGPSEPYLMDRSPDLTCTDGTAETPRTKPGHLRNVEVVGSSPITSTL
jgi:hypothetical protein